MTAFIDENTQFSTNGKPIVNGKIYIGVNGQDPILNPIIIFSDRELSIELANPQILDAEGRSTNKIWIPEKYSFRVDNTNDVQQLIDLDAGEVQTTGTTILTDAQGTNAITANASPTISSYVNGQVYTLQPANTNTGATTLNIDGLGAIEIKSVGSSLVGGELTADLTYLLSFNSALNQFDLLTITVAAKTQGKDTIWVPSGTMAPLTTNGCASLTQVEGTAGRPEQQTLNFDATVAESAQFAVAFPKSWNKGTVTFQVFWTGLAGAGDVVWEMAAVAIADDEAIDTAYGSPIEIVDTFIAADDLHVSAESSSITIAGSPTDDELVYFKLSRDAVNASDTRAVDSNILGMKLFFTTNAGNDA